jgi:hypothetical protein
MAANPIYIPTFISSITYQPARVLPHVYFWNGTLQTNQYFIQGYNSPSTSSVETIAFDSFPYFDNYSGQNLPTTESLSLLFNNEAAVYGETPTGSLYSEYWETYVSLLYNPRTRLLNASAIIPLADYFKMELNDVVEFRGNYYHLRAINDYNLSNGECDLELLGPIIGDTLTQIFDIGCAFDFTSVQATIPTTLTPTTATPTTATPTETPTTLVPTTTAPVFYTYFTNRSQDNGFTSSGAACGGGTTTTTIYSTKATLGSITNGDTLYSSPTLSAVWNGNLEWYGLSATFGGAPVRTVQPTTFGIIATTSTCS